MRHRSILSRSKELSPASTARPRAARPDRYTFFSNRLAGTEASRRSAARDPGENPRLVMTRPLLQASSARTFPSASGRSGLLLAGGPLPRTSSFAPAWCCAGTFSRTEAFLRFASIRTNPADFISRCAFADEKPDGVDRRREAARRERFMKHSRGSADFARRPTALAKAATDRSASRVTSIIDERDQAPLRKDKSATLDEEFMAMVYRSQVEDRVVAGSFWFAISTSGRSYDDRSAGCS